MRDFWNQRYGEPDLAYGLEPNEFLVDVVDRLPAGSSVLCIAEGYGRNALYLAAKGFRVAMVDYSTVGVERARRLASELGLTLDASVVDLADFSFPPVDVIVAVFAHFPPPLRRAVHQRAFAALKPGGSVVIEAFNPGQLARSSGGPRSVELLYSVDTLREDFAGAEFEVLEERTIELDEGPYHAGTAEVVRMLARKPLS